MFQDEGIDESTRLMIEQEEWEQNTDTSPNHIKVKAEALVVVCSEEDAKDSKNGSKKLNLSDQIDDVFWLESDHLYVFNEKISFYSQSNIFSCFPPL